jgi:hypothetical protein
MSDEKKYNHLESFFDLYYYIKNNMIIHSVNWDKFLINILLNDNESIVSVKMIPDSKYNAVTQLFKMDSIVEDFTPDANHSNFESIIDYIHSTELKIDIRTCPMCRTKFKC